MVFFDDFDDRDAEDGNPVTWVPVPGFPGTFDASSGDYLLATSERAIVTGVPAYELEDVSIRTPVRILAPSAPVGGIELIARGNRSTLDGYLGGFNEEAIAYIRRTDMPGQPSFAMAQTNLRPLEKDVMLQFDVFGDDLSMWAWRADEPMPTTPLLSATDDRLSVGEVAIDYFSLESDPMLGSAVFRFVHVANSPIRDLMGDFNYKGLLETEDLDALTFQVRGNSHATKFDLNNDKLVDQNDRRRWVSELGRTYFGDSNLDGEFNSQDLIAIFQVGQYEDGVSGNSTWSTGDWDGNGDFDSGDLVFAFQDGGYEKGPRMALITVPEPSACWPGILAVVGTMYRRRLRRSW
jgi:hypothetical protein